MSQSLSLYIHIPFCQRKCHYCDFNTYAGLGHLLTSYVAALKQEMVRWSSLTDGYEVETIFFGGGTPSLLAAGQVQEILELCRQSYSVAREPEVTLEANPGTVDQERLEGFRAAGVNRLSFGAQSFDPQELQWLGRIHSTPEIGQAVRMARRAGFTRINLDLIYGLPQQPLANWERSVQAALALEPDHLSLYALTVEEGTPLAQWVKDGSVAEPDPDMAADHYLAAAHMLPGAGFDQYEISNWARSGQECRHNLTYWRNMPYLGFGASAHSSFGGLRFSNVLLPQDYIGRLGEGSPSPLPSPRHGGQALKGEGDLPLPAFISKLSPLADIYEVDAETDLSDTLILGLRLREGIAFQRVLGRHGVDVKERFGAAIRELSEMGLLEAGEQAMRLTPHGRLLANEVFVRFLPAAVHSS